MSTRDDVSKLYIISGRLHLIGSLLFWINFILAILLLYFPTNFDTYIILSQIIISLLYIISEILDTNIFWFKAEKMRFMHCIENSLNIQRTDYQTNGYYNNDIEPSILKYCINTFENIFFTNTILLRMYWCKVVFLILLVLFFIIISIESINRNLIYLVAQTAFSMSCLGSLVSFFIFASKISTLYENLNSLYKNCSIKDNINLIYSYSLEYDYLKAFYKVRLSSRLFNKVNNELSKQWEDKYKRVLLD